MKYKRLVGCLLSGLMLFSTVSILPTERIVPDLSIQVSALTSSEVTNAITNLKNTRYPEGYCWYNEYSTDAAATKVFNGSQCVGFARNVGNIVFGSFPNSRVSNYSTGQTLNGWTAIRGNDVTYVEPGDIIRTDGHAAIVWYVDGNNIYVAEAWGSSGNTIHYGFFNGARKNATLAGIKANNSFLGVWRHPEYTGNSNNKKWYENYTALDLGNNFDAVILAKESWITLRAAEDANVILHSEQGCSSEMWRFVKQNDGSYTIQNFYNGKFLDAFGMGTTNGTNVFTCELNNGENQKWFIYNLNNGYVLRPAHTDLVLDVTGAIFETGTNIQIHEQNNTSAQTFALYYENGNYGTPKKSGLSAKVSGRCVTLSINRAAYADKYKVYRSLDDVNYQLVGETTDYTFVDDALEYDTQYFYKIEYTNRYYSSSYSDSVSVKTEKLVPSKPNLTIKAGTSFHETIFEWNACENATHYDLRVFNSDGSLAYAMGHMNQANEFDSYATFTDTHFSKTLPAGSYYATVCSVNENSGQWISSDEVSFIVINELSISFNANGGICSTTDKSVFCGGTYGTLPTPSRTGYVFNGWYTEKTDGIKITDDTIVTATENHTLYAHWTPNQYTLYVNPNGGIYDNSTSTVTKSPNLVYDSSNWYSIGKALKTGYALTGYFTESSGGTKIYDAEGTCIESSLWKNNNYKNTGDLTVYAQWVANQYTIDFDANGGEVSLANQKATYDEKYGALPLPAKEGCIFQGWYTEKTAGVKVTDDMIFNGTKDQTLYAHWRVKGDIDTDDKIGVTDIITVQKYLHRNNEFTKEQYEIADMNGDGKVNVIDLALMKRQLLQK